MQMMFYSSIEMSVVSYESIGVIIVQIIRSMSHCVTCSDLIGLLKSCVLGFSVKWHTDLSDLLFDFLTAV